MTNMTRRHKKVATRVLMSVIGLLCLIGWVGAPIAAAEELEFTIGLDWKEASADRGHGQLMIEFVPKGDRHQ